MSTGNIASRWQSFTPHFHAALRIVSSLIFIQAGTMKLFAFPIGMPPDNGTAPLFSEMWFAGFLETFGGAFMLVGLYARPVGFILSGEMAVAYFQVHFPKSPWTVANHGEAAVLLCFVWLYFSAAGAGELSFDAKRMSASFKKRMQIPRGFYPTPLMKR